IPVLVLSSRSERKLCPPSRRERKCARGLIGKPRFPRQLGDPSNLIRVILGEGTRIMATSIFLARLLGPLLLAVGAGILINPKPFHTMASEVVRSMTLVYLFGLFDFAAGLAIVLTHNVWAANWRVLITILGWLMLIR